MASIRANPNGTFWARVCLGRDERTGKQIWRSRTFQPVENMTPAKAEKELRRRVDEWERQERADYEQGLEQHRDKMPLERFTRENWWTYTTGRGLSHNTIISMKKLSETVTEHFGPRIKLVEISRAKIDTFISWLRTEKRYSDRTTRMNFDVLRSILDYATETGYLSENPIEKMKVKDRPHVSIDEPDFLTESEATAFLEALDADTVLPELWKTYFQLLLFAGVRRSEGLALTWADYNPDKRELLISKSVTLTGEAEAATAIKDTKTGKRRRVYVSDSLAAALERHRQDVTEKYGECSPDWYIFGKTQNPQEPRNPNQVYQRLARFQKRHGLRRTSVHLLRHSFASLALGAGADLAAIQKALGHSRASMTLTYYAGCAERQERGAAAAVEKAVKKPTQATQDALQG